MKKLAKSIYSWHPSPPFFYGWLVLGTASIGALIATVIDAMILGYPIESYGPVYIVFEIVILIPYFAVGARRLHDINKSGWWQLLILTLIGIILLIIWWATVGKNKKNIHGLPIKLKK